MMDSDGLIETGCVSKWYTRDGSRLTIDKAKWRIRFIGTRQRLAKAYGQEQKKQDR